MNGEPCAVSLPPPPNPPNRFARRGYPRLSRSLPSETRLPEGRQRCVPQSTSHRFRLAFRHAPLNELVVIMDDDIRPEPVFHDERRVLAFFRYESPRLNDPRLLCCG